MILRLSNHANWKQTKAFIGRFRELLISIGYLDDNQYQANLCQNNRQRPGLGSDLSD